MKVKSLLFVSLATLICVGSPAKVPVVDTWKYTLKKPADNWHQAAFDDRRWMDGPGGFGVSSTPGSRVGTPWSSNDIWLRKSFKLDAVPEKPALLIHHDEDAVVYINGRRVTEQKGFLDAYKVIPIEGPLRSALRVGRNVMAVHCHQTRGGQFIDVHVVDAGNVPKLAPAAPKPFQSKLMTKWGEQVTPENAWQEYPRPAMKRNNWKNLNGLWNYAVTGKDVGKAPGEWDGKILVPFAIESSLSGVKRRFMPDDVLWYQRTVEVDKQSGRRYLLNFEAVDYQSTLWVNGKEIGSHTGGNLPFSFDVTDALKNGENTLTLRVTDATDTAYQLHGKQRLQPKGIWYTPVSGIWQTVWLEDVPELHITGIKIDTQIDGTVDIGITTSKGGNVPAVVTASLDGKMVWADEGRANALQLAISSPRLWSPETPTLYDLEITVGEDTVTSYVGLRVIGRTKDKAGHWRFTLNGKRIFHWGTLDQGWWPDGLHTPPSDEAMRSDIEYLKAAGFNAIRKHIKVEPRRYYYHCDRIGMMMWQDQVSAMADNPKWTRLQPNPETRTWPEAAHRQFMAELKIMIDTLYNHPCIVQWVPFNERWGQHQSIEVGEWVKKYDPTRHVNIASGGNFFPVGHIVDAHKYPHPGFPFEHAKGGRFDDFIKVMGEFGGHGFPVEGHVWNPGARNWGYGGLPKNMEEWLERYRTSIRMLAELKQQGIDGGIYTQTTDVEGEINGLLTYDRKVPKIPAKVLAELHKVLFAETPQQAAKADTFSREAFVEVPTNRKPGPVMDADTIRAGLKSHDRALYIKAGWIRDPYITLGPDDDYYLTGTQPREGDPREAENPYNIGLGKQSIVGDQVRLWRSKDLVEWESLGPIFTVDDTMKARSGKKLDRRLIWAPEVHWLGDRWALVHCPSRHSSFVVSQGKELKGPWTHPMKGNMGQRHDPSLFQDDDGTMYLLWQNTQVAPLSQDLSSYTAEPVRIDPAGSRPGPDGKLISRIGHEGATMIKVGGKYVHLGTAWSTDRGRRGSYNLYYCVADKITGPYGPRKFAGRFLGHGTPFKDKNGKWWCTAFFNANVPPLGREGIRKRDLSENAQTINEQGVTIVPLSVKIDDRGEVHIRAIDPDYAHPGPDEAQDF